MTYNSTNGNTVYGKCPYIADYTTKDYSYIQLPRNISQLNEFMCELALFFRYLVFSDPPGAKIGCGGATMYVLEALEEAIPKEELEKGMVMKVY